MQKDIDISHLSGYRTQAKAQYFYSFESDNIQELQTVLHEANNLHIPILIVSGGRNCLFAFDVYEGLVIHNNAQWYSIQNGQWVASSWQSIWELSQELENLHKISYWHRFLWLPGSIGGAVYGNAWCFGLEIGPYVTAIDVIDIVTGERFSISYEELHFWYRWSECKNHPEWLVLYVHFDLRSLREKYPSQEDPLVWREQNQPLWLSCGSFFKNPSREDSAGSLIEKVWLKWYHHGWAYFSDKHANFLMSDGTAHWSDLIALKELAEKKILDKFSIQLETEVRIIK